MADQKAQILLTLDPLLVFVKSELQTLHPLNIAKQ